MDIYENRAFDSSDSSILKDLGCQLYGIVVCQ